MSEEPGRWQASQRIDHLDPARANGHALLDLEGGASALTLVAHKTPAARDFGAHVGSLNDLDRTPNGTMLDLIHLRLDGGLVLQMAALLLAPSKVLARPSPDSD